MADVSPAGEAFKAQGNEHFKGGEWLKAAASYTQAIRLDPENPVLYSNRAAALTKLTKISKAIEDADKVIALKPEWEKGWWRKAEALEAAERHQEALEVLQAAHKLNPSVETNVKIKMLTKIMKDTAKPAKPAKDQPQPSAGPGKGSKKQHKAEAQAEQPEKEKSKPHKAGGKGAAKALTKAQLLEKLGQAEPATEAV